MDNIQEYVVNENQQQHYSFLFDQQTTHANVELCFYVDAYAAITVHVLVIQTSMHIKIKCVLRGQGAQAQIRGAYRLSEEHSVVIDTFQHHEVSHTSSTLIMKGVLYDKSQAQYYGTIRVEKDAHGTYASQENKNIMLSSAARAVSVPTLEVLTNDVKCFHGSAIGTFDEEQLFYAAMRGMDEKLAQVLLLDAFFADVVDDGLRDKICFAK